MLTGGCKVYQNHIHLTSDIFLNFWKKTGFIPPEAPKTGILMSGKCDSDDQEDKCELTILTRESNA
ncbi:unnamed protein product [Ixodes persulcatus]